MRKSASKVSKRLSKLKTGNVIGLSDYRQQKKAAEELFDQIATTEQNIQAGRDPLHAVYIQLKIYYRSWSNACRMFRNRP